MCFSHSDFLNGCMFLQYMEARSVSQLLCTLPAESMSVILVLHQHCINPVTKLKAPNVTVSQKGIWACGLTPVDRSHK